MLQQDVIMEDPVWSFPSSLTFPTCGFHLTELIGLVRDILLSDREFPQWFWVFWSDSWDSHRFSWWFILAYYAITCFLCASEIRYLLVIADSFLRTATGSLVEGLEKARLDRTWKGTAGKENAGELENSLALGTLTSEDLTMYGWAGPTSKATPTDSEMGFALSYTWLDGTRSKAEAMATVCCFTPVRVRG